MIIEKLKKLSYILDNYQDLRNNNYKSHDDQNSWQVLRPLLDHKPIIPFTKYSLSPFSIALVINDIIIHKRRCVVELGSGAFTQIFSRLIHMNDLDVKFYSVESDINWLNKIKENLEKEHCEEKVTFIHAPLVEEWYDCQSLKQSLTDHKVDCLVVDGPKTNKGNERNNALPFFKEYLDLKSFSIFLDDANRKGEQKILKSWSQMMNLEAYIVSKRIGIIQKNSPYYIAPSWHSEDLIVKL